MELVDEQNGALFRWFNKPVINSVEYDLYQDYDRLIQVGTGFLTPCRDFTKNGKGSIKLDTPNSTAIKNPTNRRYDYSGFFYPLDHLDLREYNRLSLWVYIDAPGLIFDTVILELHNTGKHIIPVPGRFEGEHHTLIHNCVWTKIIWEIPDLYRDDVIGIKAYCSLHGTPMNAAPRKTLYFEDLKIETVANPEKSRGFSLAENSIAYCHSGYRPEARKQALIQNQSASDFAVYNEKGEKVFEDAIINCKDGFGLLDFSAIITPGNYTIQVGNLISKPFPIGPDAFLSAAWKALNFFFCERCGFEVPGIHIECHLDAYCRHPDGRTIPIHGGWHDAADVSQSIDKTCDVIVAMLDLADATATKDPALHTRVLEEARWGLNWVMRTRFGDGYRHTSLTKGIWTENYRGDKDDIEGMAQNTAIHNYTASYTCAYAAPFFQEDSYFYEWCLRCAEEDFFFAQERLESSEDNSLMSERLALATAAGAMLSQRKMCIRDSSSSARFNFSSTITHPPFSSFQLKNRLDFHRQISREHIYPDCGTGRNADLFSENILQQLRRSICNGGLLIKIIFTRHKTEDFYHIFHPVKTSCLFLYHRKHVQHRHTRIILPFFQRKFLSQLSPDRHVRRGTAAGYIKQAAAEFFCTRIKPALRRGRRQFDSKFLHSFMNLHTFLFSFFLSVIHPFFTASA